ncbi:sensor histidine kinase [Roseospira visakhapatnamensis]|uniref:histidine kinase n=1 Tax=Roseospira visakhapatnamensis TaxID=390880 RepID=A0A7W6REB7_9PROT|nr:ATP-binding protein [Roseospira visakhapatnamensis]MBB4266491.1 signal transduction histidine kinase [Roseospira visakhapatnamensis]
MRIRTLLVVSTVVLVVSGSAALLALSWAADQVAQARVGSRIAGEIVTAVFELNALASEYLETEDERPRRQWRTRHESLLALLDSLPEAIRRERPEPRQVRDDVEQVGHTFAQLSQAIGEDGTTVPHVQIETMWRKRQIAEIRRLSQTIVETSAAMDQDLTNKTEKIEKIYLITTFSFITGAVILFLSIWLLISRRVLGQMRVLQKGILALEAGRLDYRIRLDGTDEISEVATAFDGMAAELERSHKELAQFAYVASHDLQEPLRMVASYTALLSKRYGGQLDARADKYIGYAVAGAKRMQDLLNDLLAFSRVGTRGRPFEPTDCGAVVTEAMENLRQAIDESGARVTRGPLPTVSADGRQLVQVFQNLIANAIRYRREDAPKIDIAAERHDDLWTFSVRDNGIGIEPEFVDRIFMIFQRLHPRSESDGNGIGLAIVKKVIERHGGSIWVESQPGQGSTFFFTLGGGSQNREQNS